MSNLNLQISTIAYSDITPSNKPQIRSWDYTFKLLGQNVNFAKSENYSIAPGSTQIVYNGTKTTLIDGTTAFNISQPYPAQPNVYRFTATAGTDPVFRTARSISIDDTSQIIVTVNGPIQTFTGAGSAAQAASFVGQIGGMTTPVTIVALTAGAAGNINLAIDGVSSINQLVVAWNTANPSNQIQVQAGNDAQVPTGGSFVFTGGVDGVTALNTSAIVIGDILKIYSGSGFSYPNQGTFTVIAKTSNSITVQNLNAVAETVTILDPTLFLVYSNGGGNSNQVQIGNKVIISAGFSQVTQGTYIVTDVTPSSFEISIAPPNGIPIETGIMPGASGLVFYSSARQFVMIAAQQKCSVQVNADTSNNSLLEPVEPNNQERPALYLKQGTVYALSITNLSIQTLSVIIASAE